MPEPSAKHVDDTVETFDDGETLFESLQHIDAHRDYYEMRGISARLRTQHMGSRFDMSPTIKTREAVAAMKVDDLPVRAEPGGSIRVHDEVEKFTVTAVEVRIHGFSNVAQPLVKRFEVP